MKNLTTRIVGIMLLLNFKIVAAQDWSLTGNAATNPSTQFIGTTDNKALKFRTNNSVRLTISSAGKVGIGTASPAFKLDIKGGSINTDSVYRIGGITVLSVKGSANVFTGADAGKANTTGYFNAALGAGALQSNTTAAYNTANGAYALQLNTTGQANTANGAYALNANTTGYYNSATGSQALQFNTTGHDNTANGYLALYANTTGNYNTATGAYTLQSNSTGSVNTANGYQALYSNTTGGYHCAIGYTALHSNTTANFNTAIGYSVLYTNTTGYSNTATGFDALYANSTGNNNTAHGVNALVLNSTGNYNTALGSGALNFTETSSYNTAVGYAAGDGFNNGSLNVFVGEECDATVAGLSNVVAVGQGTLVGTSNQARIGNSGTSSIGGYADWTNISDGRYKKNIKENVPGLEFINKLRPVTYNLDASGLDAFLHKNNKVELSAEAKSVYEKALTEKQKIVNTGFIAQEVEVAAKKIGYDFSGVDAAKNENDVYGLRYAEFVVPLVKAVQELSQQNIDLKKEVEEMKSSANGFAREQVSPLGGDLEGALLGQNIPNPFDNSTLIPFRIPKDCNGGSIMITNTSTSQVMSVIPISCNQDHVSVDAGMLASGAYSYSLFVDGKLIDKKEMLITK